MTDNEIIKALEHCKRPIGQHDCENCPYVSSRGMCTTNMLNDAISLINRQKAEVERLRNTVKTDFLTATEQLKLSQSEIVQIRTEAVKEFAERLKSTMFNEDFLLCEPCDMANIIDNLVKEMTE